MAQTELKPCPFCGNKIIQVEIEKLYANPDLTDGKSCTTDTMIVWCKVCGGSIRSTLISGLQNKYELNKKWAIESWNRRVTDAD